MQALLQNPAVQAGLIPFVVALVVAELLQRVRLSGLALVLAFAAMVYLTHVFAFGVLTAPRKIVVLGLAAPLFAILPAVFQGAWVRPLLTALGAAAAVWMAWRILENQALARMLLWGAGGAAYTAWLVYWSSKLHNHPVRAGAAGMALGVGTGVAAIFGASLTLGMFGAALGAAAARRGWITGEAARAHVQRLRHEMDAILVGVGTVVADDPLLTDRTGRPRRRPLLRVALDSRLRLPPECRLVQSAHHDVVVFCVAPEDDRRRTLEARGVRVEQVAAADGGRPDWRAVLRRLGEMEINGVLVEGGATGNWGALEDGVGDTVFFY